MSRHCPEAIYTVVVVAASFSLSACVSVQPSHAMSSLDKQTRLECEQQAVVAQAQYLARVKTPMYAGSISSTWAGGARADTGKWVFDSALQTCVMHAQHAGEQ